MLNLAYITNKKGNQILGVITKLTNTLITSFKSKVIYISFTRN